MTNLKFFKVMIQSAAFIFFVGSLAIAAETHAKTNHRDGFLEYFKTSLKRAGAQKPDSIIILRAESEDYEWFFLSVNGKVVGPATNKDDSPVAGAAMDLFELVERDASKAEPPLSPEQKQQLCTEVAQMLLKEKKLSPEEIMGRGKRSGYFSCEKSAYLNLKIPIFQNAKIIEAKKL